MVTHVFNQHLGEGSEVQGQPQVHRQFQATLGYMRPCLYKKKNTEAGDMAQWLRALAVILTEELGSVPSINMMANNHL